MRDFPSCFSENGVQVADASCSTLPATKSPQNSVTRVYRCKLLGKSCLITISWSKNLFGQCLSVEIDDGSQPSICRVDVKPSLFSKRKGSKSLELDPNTRIEVFWDISGSRFGSGPEPLSGYYTAIVSQGTMVLLMGDLKKEAFKKTGASNSLSSPIFVSKREHVSGKRVFTTKAQFSNNGPAHDLRVEYDPNQRDDPSLVVRVDSKTVVVVRHLRWKFRGNHTILVDGLPVEVFWDVHDWLFGPGLGHAVFMFRTSLSAEKMWAGPLGCDSVPPVLSWSCPEVFGGGGGDYSAGLGFSFFLYAWMNE